MWITQQTRPSCRDDEKWTCGGHLSIVMHVLDLAHPWSSVHQSLEGEQLVDKIVAQHLRKRSGTVCHFSVTEVWYPPGAGPLVRGRLLRHLSRLCGEQPGQTELGAWAK